jgi:hypothetical protein
MCGREEEFSLYHCVSLWGRRFDSRAVHLEVVGEQSDTETDFFLHRFLLSPVGVMLPILHTHIYLPLALYNLST